MVYRGQGNLDRYVLKRERVEGEPTNRWLARVPYGSYRSFPSWEAGAAWLRGRWAERVGRSKR